MSFADNLVYLRQHYGVTQEALAEKLGVSRQTVSKWEAGINYPETDKLLALCDLFNTNLDDLLRGSVHVVNRQDTELYDAHMNRRNIALAVLVALILMGVSALVTLEALGLPSNVSTIVLLSFIVVAVTIGIVLGLNHSEFKRKHAGIEPRYSTEELDRFGRRFPIMIAAGVGLILLDVIMLIGLSPESGSTVDLGFVTFDEEFIMGPFMFIMAIAVGLLVYAGTQKEKYDVEEMTYVLDDSVDPELAKLAAHMNAKTPQQIKRDHIVGSICGAIMIFAVIVFLVGGFIPNLDALMVDGIDKWDVKELVREGHGGFAVSWLAFPVGGLLCAIVAIIAGALNKSEQEIIAEYRRENPWMKIAGETEKTDVEEK